MPNWCLNQLTVTGQTEELDAFVESFVDGDTARFDQLIPVPDSVRDDNSNYEMSLVNRVINMSARQSFGENLITPTMDWKQTNWGTRANTHLDEIEHEPNKLVCEFLTAWTPAAAFFKTVGKRYRRLRFELRYDEPGNDLAGTVIVEDGQTIQEEKYPSPIREANEE